VKSGDVTNRRSERSGGVGRYRRAVPAGLRLRSARFRPAVLVIVWALSGVWSVGHAVAHEIERAHGHHLTGAAEIPVVAMAAAHGHGHSHPEPLPLVATGKAPKLDALALLTTATPEFACVELLGRRCVVSEPVSAFRGAAVASGPRAPPRS
jgi:hypothetical protein